MQLDQSKTIEELKLAHLELLSQHQKLLKCSEALIVANAQLIIQHEEKDKQDLELLSVNESLKASQEQQKEHIRGLVKMLFMISHKIRQPVAHILGLSELLENDLDLSEEIKQRLAFMRQSALSLDELTRELSAFIQEKKIECENIL